MSAKKWTVTVTSNPNYCGVGAGETHFAHGQAVITNKRLADWFAAHKGYEVEPVQDAEPVKAAEPAQDAEPAKDAEPVKETKPTSKAKK